jgi:uncharacterized protein (TIGR03435 family)
MRPWKSRSNEVVLLLAAAVCLAAPIFAQSAGAQETRDVASKTPEFEVASIRPTDAKTLAMVYRPSLDRFTVTGLTVRNLIYFAYNIKYGYNTGGPGWVDYDQFDVDAKIDDAFVETYKKMTEKERDAQLRLMLQALLKERFKLEVKTETKELPIFALVVAKRGLKMKPSAAETGDAAKQGARWSRSTTNGLMKLTAKNASLDGLVGNLVVQPSVNRMVVDDTGLKGPFDFELEWAINSDSSGPDIFAALQEQLGLKLEPRKGPVETLVVEHVEKPSEN